MQRRRYYLRLLVFEGGENNIFGGVNRAQVITEDYLSSGVPTLIAKAGVRALDQQTGILYEQVKVSQGAVYKEVGKFYYQPSYTPENIENKVTTLDSPNNTTYPTTLAISTALSELVIAGEFNIDFEEGSSHRVAIIVQAAIQAGDIITFRPTTRQEDFAVEQIEITVTSLSAGVGFEITAIAPSSTSGVYSIQYTIL